MSHAEIMGFPNCQCPTKSRWDLKLHRFVHEPGRCDNYGRFQFEGLMVCAKHLRVLKKKKEATCQLEKVRVEISTRTGFPQEVVDAIFKEIENVPSLSKILDKARTYLQVLGNSTAPRS